MREFAKNNWQKEKKLSISIKNNLKSHLWEKQDLYLPVLIAALILSLVFVSKTAFSKTVDSTNNLPINDNYKVRLIGTDLKNQEGKLCSPENDEYRKNLANAELKAKTGEDKKDLLKKDVEKIVKGTPMAAMIESISEKPRPVAAFIVGIAMKESKFGVYSPKKNGRDCYNYWGFKGGGTTVAGGYSCFNSPEQAVEKVGGKIEKLVNRGVKSPAQMVSWKCGSSCAGHGAENVRKWISDVAINFYKIDSRS
ncbi:MAG: hypothetical protein WC831_03100 [Parcubacteria group bacterium]